MCLVLILKFEFMKKIIFLMICMLLFSVSLFAQGATVISDAANAFATFASLVAIIPFVAEAIKKVFKAISPLAIQFISWGAGLSVTLFGWAFGLGFLADLIWWQAILYGFGASLAANGVFDTGIIEYILLLFSKKKD